MQLVDFKTWLNENSKQKIKTQNVNESVIKITSIGFLYSGDGNINLTPCINGSSFPTLVKVTKEEYAKTKGDKEKMIKLALSKLESQKISIIK